MSKTDMPAGAAGDVSALLRYALTTDPFPLEASPITGAPESATLKVVGSNPDPSNPITLRSITISVPVGPDAAQLTNVTPEGPVAPDGWTLQQTKLGENVIEYVFKPGAGEGKIAGRGLAFVFNNIQPNTQPGVCVIDVTEGGEDGAVTQLPVTKFPNDWGEVIFSADPPIVPYGGSTTLRWSGPASATYTIQYYTPRTGIVNVPSPGEQPLSNRGRYPAQGAKPLQLLQNTIFYLTVVGVIHGKPYSAQKTLDVTVATLAPEITSFKAEPPILYGYTIVNQNVETSPALDVKLSWATQHAKECELSGVSQLLSANTSVTQQLKQSQRYVLTAYGYVEPPATQTLNVPFKSVVRATVQFRLARPYFELNYTLEVPVPANSNVTIELVMFGQTTEQKVVSNPSNTETPKTISAVSKFTSFDTNMSFVVTCTGQTSYRVVCPLTAGR